MGTVDIVLVTWCSPCVLCTMLRLMHVAGCQRLWPISGRCGLVGRAMHDVAWRPSAGAASLLSWGMSCKCTAPTHSAEEQVNDNLQRSRGTGTYTVYGLSYCPFCLKAKTLLERAGASYDYTDVDQQRGMSSGPSTMMDQSCRPLMPLIPLCVHAGYCCCCCCCCCGGVGREGRLRRVLLDKTGQRTFPNIFQGGEHVGGCDDLQVHLEKKESKRVRE